MVDRYKDGKKIKSKAKPDVDPVDWDTFENRLKRATDREELLTPGDIFNLGTILKTGSDQPIRPYLCDFLYRAFCEINNGIDPSEALRMKNKGRPNDWTVHDKVMVCAIVNRLIVDGKTLKDLYQEVALAINSEFENIKTPEQQAAAYKECPAWSAFFGKKIHQSTIKEWYQNYSPVAIGARTIDKK